MKSILSMYFAVYANAFSPTSMLMSTSPSPHDFQSIFRLKQEQKQSISTTFVTLTYTLKDVFKFTGYSIVYIFVFCVEALKVHFDVRAQDSRLNNPEYILLVVVVLLLLHL